MPHSPPSLKRFFNDKQQCTVKPSDAVVERDQSCTEKPYSLFLYKWNMLKDPETTSSLSKASNLFESLHASCSTF